MKKMFFGISMMLLSAMSFTVMAQTQESAKCNNNGCEKEAVCAKAECAKDKKECCAKDKKECTKDKKECCAKDKKECAKDKKECAKDKKECKGMARKCDRGVKCDSAALHGRRFDKDARLGGPLGQGHRFEGGLHGKPKKANLFEGIDLTAKQQAELKALDEKMGQKRSEMKAEAKDKKREMKADIKKDREAARAEYEAEVKKILTAEQYAVFEANRDAKKVGTELRKDGKRAAEESKKLEKKALREADKAAKAAEEKVK